MRIPPVVERIDGIPDDGSAGGRYGFGMEKREPFWGPNARMALFQFVLSFAIYHFVVWTGVGDLVYRLSCTYLTGSCQAGP